ncbi:MAG: response regulator transcription factor [Lachnospiraceae bacterium]|nr:response regulator transcription factor [Lachnospiraceae bacterium]
MHQYTVAVVDDRSEIRVQLREYLETYETEHRCILKTELFDTGEELLRVYDQEEYPFEILILDVELPGVSGVEIARQIRKKDSDVSIIFLTGYDRYALDAFRVGAMGYFMKPIQYVSLKAKISEAILKIDYINELHQKQQKYLTVINHYQQVQIEISQIIYIEKHRNLCIIHCQGVEYACYISLYRLYKQLPMREFCYCHQGYVVNFTKVRSVGKTDLLMESLDRVPLSRRYYKELHLRKIQEVVGYQELLMETKRRTGNE